MKTEIAIDGTQFRINGQLTYADGNPSVHGFLFNSRMIQAIFDDANPDTAIHWRYPDTGIWDAERNTREFVTQLPVYREHGLLAVTVGLQGGGSIYRPDVYHHYRNSAFTPRGELKSAYQDRLLRILQAADALGMVVIVNYLYCQQIAHFSDKDSIPQMVQNATEWLLQTGYRNILVDIVNESNAGLFAHTQSLHPERVHELIERVQGTTLEGRRLLVSISTGGGDEISHGKWRELEDFGLPHGNCCTPEQLRRKLLRLKTSPEYESRPRPIVVNEDSPDVAHLDVAHQCGASWGFYTQGYGSDYHSCKVKWASMPREGDYEALSGFQTLPVNWSLNTDRKRAFFTRLKSLVYGEG